MVNFVCVSILNRSFSGTFGKAWSTQSKSMWSVKHTIKNLSSLAIPKPLSNMLFKTIQSSLSLNSRIMPMLNISFHSSTNLFSELHSETKDKKKFTLGSDFEISSNVKSNEVNHSNEKKEQKKAPDDKAVRTVKFTFYVMGVMITTIGAFLIYSWGAPQTDLNGKKIEDQFSNLPLLQQYFYRTINEAKNMNNMIIEPSSDKLLPDPLKEPYIQPPYTLVLEMKDILVHPEWTYETGWRFKKRPGVDFLLQHCGPPLFEVVIYTNEQAFTAYPVIEQLDPNGYIWYKLFKDSTRYTNGKHLKDLNCLNRDLEKVIIVDWDKEAVTSLRNQLSVSRWLGNMNDQSLVELAIMLRTIAESQVSDVREVLDYYRSFSDPIAAFKENQRIAHEHELELQKSVQEQTSQRSLTSSWTSSFLKRK